MHEQIPRQGTPEPRSESDEPTLRFSRSAPPEQPVRCAVCGHPSLTPNLPCVLCGAEAGGREPSSVDEALVVDGRYLVECELGRGAMGVVYLAKDTWLGRPVALKTIEPTWAEESPSAVTHFLREARALASIRNQYVVQVYAFGLHGSAHFFAMEYVRGSTLRQILAEHRDHGDTVPVHRTLTILNRIAQGIDAVHAAGIVHRDVKPSNIVIEEHTGRPVLLDFGLAVHSEDPAAAQAAGTPQYMAPEQVGSVVSGASITVRTDVYALGITAFEMLAGQLPFPSTDRAQLLRHHASKTPPLLSSIRRDLAPFDKILSRALAKDPEERYPSCTAFAEVLAVAGERWTNSRLPTLPPPMPAVSSAAMDWVALPPSTPSPSPLPVPMVGDPPAQPVPMVGDPPAQPVTTGDTPSSVSPVPAPPVVRPCHVLVVDDSPVFRKFTVQATQIAFFRCRKTLRLVVDGAGSGEEACAHATEQPPDLVLLDFDMPGLDGVGTLSRLRALPGGDRARVMVISGRVSPADRWRFEVLGVSDFVAKPIDFRQLVDRIEGIARRIEEREGSGR